MKRKMLGALLLPLPFAALPIAAVLFSATPADNGEGLVVQTPMPLEQPVETVASTGLPAEAPGDATLAYGVGGQAEGECSAHQLAAGG
jgi:hypothetical protein